MRIFNKQTNILTIVLIIKKNYLAFGTVLVAVAVLWVLTVITPDQFQMIIQYIIIPLNNTWSIPYDE